MTKNFGKEKLCVEWMDVSQINIVQNTQQKMVEHYPFLIGIMLALILTGIMFGKLVFGIIIIHSVKELQDYVK